MSSRIRYVLEKDGQIVERGPRAIAILKRAFKQRVGEDADNYIKRNQRTFLAWSRAQLVAWIAQNVAGDYTVRMYKEKRGVRGLRSQYWRYLRTAQRQQQPQPPRAVGNTFQINVPYIEWQRLQTMTNAVLNTPTNAPTR